MSQHQEHAGLWIIGIFIALLAWLLRSQSNPILHESVTSSILTPDATTVPDPATGCPQFDTRIVATIPNNQGNAFAPIGADGVVSYSPTLPPSCPINSVLWHNVADGSYQCIPS